jgi:hypothetical protein
VISIIDSESTTHVSEEAPIDSFVQLPETESDCHQSDHAMEFHLNIIPTPNHMYQVIIEFDSVWQD